MMFDVGFEVKLVLVIDVKAIEHILHKQGMGRMKHTDVAHLWWQGQVRSNRVVKSRVSSKKKKVSDLDTKRSQSDSNREGM